MESNLKEVKFRPNTGQADYERKVKQIKKFAESDEHGQCKVTVTFRGRENAFRERGKDLLKKMADELSKHDIKFQPLRNAGRNIVTTAQTPNHK